MMVRISLLLVVIIIVSFNSVSAQLNFVSHRSSVDNRKEINFNIKLSFNGRHKESIKVLFSPMEYLQILEWDSIKGKSDDRFLKATIKSDIPVYLSSNSLLEGQKSFWLFAEPGDNITIESDGQHLQFSGIGADKFRLKYELDSILAAIPLPDKFENHKSYIYGAYTTVSVEEYLEWMKYLQRRLDCVNSITDGYKDKLSNYAYNLVKAKYIERYIDNHTHKFGALLGLYEKGDEKVSLEDICSIYDSVYFPATNSLYKWISQYIYDSYRPIAYEVRRRFSFDDSKDPLNSILKRRLLYYKIARQTFKGVAWEKFAFDFLVKFADETGFSSEAEKLLEDYYAEPSYPEYKLKVKELELKTRERFKRHHALDFNLEDAKNKNFTKKQINGKVTVIDFWFTGCIGCVGMAPVMRKVEEAFRNDSNVLFLNVSVDKNKEKWLKSIKEQRFTTGGGINLYTGGQGTGHPMIEDYAVDGYPKFFLINSTGAFISQKYIVDPRKDEGRSLISAIQKELHNLYDGPYAIYSKDSLFVYTINRSSPIKMSYSISNTPQLEVKTDKANTFKVSLKKSISTERSEYPKPDKILALSDIEGNFEALRKLLQANNVIDENYNWTFGQGHLVFNGDMFDRGTQVTECLWLIYSLEEKAKATGGYVHFILGNHEIMNLSGNHEYARGKYENTAILLEKKISQLYGNDSELGRWLRSKNIIEKIGNILFTHGGISEHLNGLQISIDQINQLARTNYSSNNKPSDDPRINIIMNDSVGLFWYRGYYKGSELEVTNAQIYNTLKKFNVDYIITGHTIVDDIINPHYNNRVINLDTKHSDGKSEALFIDGNIFYRVNQAGERNSLFSVLITE